MFQLYFFCLSVIVLFIWVSFGAPFLDLCSVFPFSVSITHTSTLYFTNIFKIVTTDNLLVIFVVNIGKCSLLWTPLHLRFLVSSSFIICQRTNQSLSSSILIPHIIKYHQHYQQHLVTSPRHQGIDNIHRVVAWTLQYKPGIFRFFKQNCQNSETCFFLVNIAPY